MEEKVKEIICEAIEELNEQLHADKKIEYSENLKLIGTKAIMDSITFVTLIAITEDLISEKLGKNIMIVNDKAFSRERSPFYSVTALSNYIIELLTEVK
jgi:acyl carrier protein